MSLLGDSLANQKEFADAEPLLIHGHEGIEAHRAEIPTDVRTERVMESLERLGGFYKAWEKPDKAEFWRQQLEEERGRISTVKELGVPK